MNPKSKRIATIVSLFLILAVSQLYIGASFAGPGPVTTGTDRARVVTQQPTGILTTSGNNAISVNGASAITGATILSGADIETPAEIGATVSLGSLGSLKIEPDTKLTLEFQLGSVKVMLIRGCVTLHTKKGTAGEVANPAGVIGRIDPADDGVIRTCPDRAAAAAIPATTGGLFGIGVGATIGVIGAVTLISLPIIFGGRNPSPSR